MKIDIILTPEQEKIATTVWQAAVAAKSTKTATVVEYLEKLFKDDLQTELNTRVNGAVTSWTPAEDPAVAARKEAIKTKLSTVDATKLTAVETVLNSK